MKKNIIFIMIIFTLSCQNSPKKYEQEIQSQHCEQALENIPENESSYKFLQSTQSAAGKIISYSLTGAAYTAEVILDVAIGTVGGIILCAPTLALRSSSYQARYESGSSIPCIPANNFIPFSPPLGRNTRSSTRTLECPSLDGLSKKVREVAQCFSQRGDAESKSKAIKTLESLENSKNFYECLSVNERNEFTKQKASLLN